MTDMRVYLEQKKAANFISNAMKKLLVSGQSIRVSSLVQTVTLDFAVSERFVKRRIELYKESDPRIIEEDGELWLRSDLSSE